MDKSEGDICEGPGGHAALQEMHVDEGIYVKLDAVIYVKLEHTQEDWIVSSRAQIMSEIMSPTCGLESSSMSSSLKLWGFTGRHSLRLQGLVTYVGEPETRT